MKAPPMTASIKEALELKPCPFCQSATGPHLYTVTDGTDESRESTSFVSPANMILTKNSHVGRWIDRDDPLRDVHQHCRNGWGGVRHD